MGMIKFQWKGLPEMQRKMRKAAEEIGANAKAAVEAEAQRILEEAKKRVPVDTGELRDSGRVVTVESGNTVTSRIEFTAEHAAHVHEDPDAQHDTTVSGSFSNPR
jgi:hypothetical protein